MTGENTNNSNVKVRELYAVKDDLQKVISDMERRILEEIKPIAAVVNQVETNVKEIDTIRTRSNIADGANTVLSAIFAVIAGWIGTR